MPRDSSDKENQYIIMRGNADAGQTLLKVARDPRQAGLFTVRQGLTSIAKTMACMNA